MKINIHEAAEVLGAEFHGPDEAITAARAIRERAGGDGHAVAVTLGEDGMVGVDFQGGGWRGTLEARGRYPVGCGDSFLAGILVGFEQGSCVGAGRRAGVGGCGRERGVARGRPAGPGARPRARRAGGRQRCVIAAGRVVSAV